MPYLYCRDIGEAARKLAATRPPDGPGFSAEIAARTERLDGIASSFRDPGPDWFRWEAYDVKDNLISQREIPGY